MSQAGEGVAAQDPAAVPGLRAGAAPGRGDRPGPSSGFPGCDAHGPRHIPLRQWGPVLRRVGRHVLDEQLLLLSAGIAFFAVLSIAPLLVTALSVYGAVHTPEEAHEQLRAWAGLLPAQLEPVATDQLTSITAASAQVVTRRGLAGLVLALWTATAAATYLIDTLTRAYHETETRSLLHRTGLALVFVLGGSVLLGAVIVCGASVGRAVTDTTGLSRAVALVLVWVALVALLTVVLAVLYRFAPDRRQPRWRWTSWGAASATALWLATSLALFQYVQTLGTYESTYGSLAGVAISMFWVWITVFLVLLGAVVNAEAERQTTRDSTVGPERPMGERGAVVADSAPPYAREL